jgi:ribonuclease HII
MCAILVWMRIELWIILLGTLIVHVGGSFNLFPSSRNMFMKLRSIQAQSVEKNLQKRGFRYIIGSDEAGRGCIAGPVVVASCCCLSSGNIDGVDDSKNLNETERLAIFREIQSSPSMYAWTVAEASNLDIDKANILRASLSAFRESIETLVEKYDLPFNATYSIVDGNKTPKLSLSIPCRPWVKGDANVYTVACASVIAKVTRDQLMMDAHKLFPEYGFDKNKGYPTRDHIQAIHTHGPCPLHRMSFKPLKGR